MSETSPRPKGPRVYAPELNLRIHEAMLANDRLRAELSKHYLPMFDWNNDKGDAAMAELATHARHLSDLYRVLEWPDG